MAVSPIVFWLVAAVILGAALAVVNVRNLVHSAFFLILTFIGVAGLYILLEADFLAAVQVVVYVGAIAIIVVLGVMLTRSHGNIANSNPSNSYRLIGGLVAGGLLGLVTVMISRGSWLASTQDAPGDTVSPIAEAMLSTYVIPFELAALLLLVAMVGAIFLAKGVKGEK